MLEMLKITLYQFSKLIIIHNLTLTNKTYTCLLRFTIFEQMKICTQIFKANLFVAKLQEIILHKTVH